MVFPDISISRSFKSLGGGEEGERERERKEEKNRYQVQRRGLLIWIVWLFVLNGLQVT